MLTAIYPEVDWAALQDPARKGRRSVLLGRRPDEYPRLNLAQVSRMAGVGRAAVVNWRRRHADFPAVVAGAEPSSLFERAEVAVCRRAHGKLAFPRRSVGLWWWSWRADGW